MPKYCVEGSFYSTAASLTWILYNAAGRPFHLHMDTDPQTRAFSHLQWWAESSHEQLCVSAHSSLLNKIRQDIPPLFMRELVLVSSLCFFFSFLFPCSFSGCHRFGFVLWDTGWFHQRKSHNGYYYSWISDCASVFLLTQTVLSVYMT